MKIQNINYIINLNNAAKERMEIPNSFISHSSFSLELVLAYYTAPASSGLLFHNRIIAKQLEPPVYRDLGLAFRSDTSLSVAAKLFLSHTQKMDGSPKIDTSITAARCN
jgi:hypothetical protein